MGLADGFKMEVRRKKKRNQGHLLRYGFRNWVNGHAKGDIWGKITCCGRWEVGGGRNYELSLVMFSLRDQ